MIRFKKLVGELHKSMIFTSFIHSGLAAVCFASYFSEQTQSSTTLVTINLPLGLSLVRFL